MTFDAIPTASAHDAVEVLSAAEKTALDEFARKLRTFAAGDVLAELEYHDAELARWGAWLADETIDAETTDLAAYCVQDHRRRSEACGRELARRNHTDRLPSGGARSRITRELIDDIKTRVDLAEMMQARGVELKTRGNKAQGRCPFHDDKTPSLTLDTARGLWHCFGCHAGGDAIQFVMQFDKVEFITALRTLADRAGVELPDAPTRTKQRAMDAEPTESASTDAGDLYLIQNGALCRRKTTPDGSVIVPLCNFSAEIVAEVARDDGAEITRLLTIQGKHQDGYVLPEARVDASQFASLKWVTPHFGTRAIINAGASAQDHLRAAIQTLSHRVQAQHVYTHLGWREIDGQRVYLTASGALGRDDVMVELEKELQVYALPTQLHDHTAAMRAALRFLDIAPLRVTLPLFAAMYLAPLAEIVPIKFMLWLYGVTGAMKSTLTALAMSHYGAFEDSDFKQWNDTSNSLEKYLFLAKDAPFVIDDFAPHADPTSARKVENTVQVIVRDAGNRTGRARMKSDLSLRAVYRPRGLAIAAGEQLPEGQSLVARLFVVEMTRGDVDKDKLSAAQGERAFYAHALAGFLQWLAPQWADLEPRIAETWRELRTRSQREGQHLRLPESIASLFVAFDLALRYAEEIDAISAADAQTLLNAGWAALRETGDKQHRHIETERPTRRYLEVLAELVAQGTARIAELADTAPRLADKDFLGWRDDDFLYLLPGESYRRVSEFVRQQGRYFGIKETALRKALAEEGVLHKENAENSTSRIRVQDKQVRVLKLDRRVIEKLYGLSP
ncbi:MAG: DNA primase [Anaerolineae bacterium]|nr:DNA primase [Anaerolineae bacterium]